MILDLHGKGELENEMRGSLKTEIETLRDKITDNAVMLNQC